MEDLRSLLGAPTIPDDPDAGLDDEQILQQAFFHAPEATRQQLRDLSRRSGKSIMFLMRQAVKIGSNMRKAMKNGGTDGTR